MESQSEGLPNSGPCPRSGRNTPSEATTTLTRNVREQKASTYSVLTSSPPRRSTIPPGIFNQNGQPYRKVSVGTSKATIQIHANEAIAEHLRISSQNSSLDQKENRKVSADLRKQLESFIGSPPRVKSPPAKAAMDKDGEKSPKWSIHPSAIALKPMQATQSITKNVWEPDAIGSPPRTPPAEFQSEYFSFPPFDSFPKGSRPHMAKRCSDKSWILLQRLRGKIVDIHNSGLRSGREGSQISTPSRNSSQSPKKMFEICSDTNQPPRRRASETPGSRPRLSSSNERLRTNQNNRAATISGRMVRFSEPTINAESKSIPIAQTSNDGATSTTSNHKVVFEPNIWRDTNHHTASRPAELKDVDVKTEDLGFVESTQAFASSIIQNIIPTNTLEKIEQSLKIDGIISESQAEGMLSLLGFKLQKQNEMRDIQSTPSPPPSEGQSPDSSDEEPTFLEYVKRFSDASPPPSRQIFPFVSPTSDSALSAQGRVDSAKKRNDKTVKSETTTRNENQATDVAQSKNNSTASKDCTQARTGSGKLDYPEAAIFRERSEGYGTITTYFYETQENALKKKWPFLYDNEIKHLIDSKWLEMEWEDIEEWAKSNAEHSGDEGYVEVDLFADLSIVNPRLQDCPSA